MQEFVLLEMMVLPLEIIIIMIMIIIILYFLPLKYFVHTFSRIWNVNMLCYSVALRVTSRENSNYSTCMA
jgi:hypothetical protein